MSAFANFKKRHEAKKIAEQASNDKPAIEAPTDTNPALRLLAALLGCDEQNAIAKGTELVEQGAYITGLTEDQLKSVEEQGESDLQDSADTATIAANDLADTAGTVNESAGTLNEAANDAADSATELSNTTEDVADSANTIAEAAVEATQAAEEIKEVAQELKKSPEEPQSLPSEKGTKGKSSSKK